MNQPAALECQRAPRRELILADTGIPNDFAHT